MNVLNDMLLRQQAKQPASFPNLRRSPGLLVTSDYGGQHKESPYESYSFAYVADSCWPRFEELRQSLRKFHGLRNRSFAFKKLGDQKKLRALDSFLRLFDGLIGMCVTVLVHKHVDSLFEANGLGDAAEASTMWPDTQITPSTFEKLLRIVHFNSFFIAGLAGEYQNLMWFTDQDDIAANDTRVGLLTETFAIVLSNYLRTVNDTLAFPLGHLRCGTTASDNGALQIEDLASVPDLVAGALAELLSLYETSGLPSTQLIIPPPDNISKKTRRIMNWLVDSSQKFQRHVYVIEPTISGHLNFKHLKFHGLTFPDC